MNNTQIKLLATCFITGCGIIAIPLGFIAQATDMYQGSGAFIPGIIAVIIGGYLTIVNMIVLKG